MKIQKKTKEMKKDINIQFPEGWGFMIIILQYIFWFPLLLRIKAQNDTETDLRHNLQPLDGSKWQAVPSFSCNGSYHLLLITLICIYSHSVFFNSDKAIAIIQIICISCPPTGI